METDSTHDGRSVKTLEFETFKLGPGFGPCLDPWAKIDLSWASPRGPGSGSGAPHSGGADGEASGGGGVDSICPEPTRRKCAVRLRGSPAPTARLVLTPRVVTEKRS